MRVPFAGMMRIEMNRIQLKCDALQIATLRAVASAKVGSMLCQSGSDQLSIFLVLHPSTLNYQLSTSLLMHLHRHTSL
jgi:hypothetical protein